VFPRCTCPSCQWAVLAWLPPPGSPALLGPHASPRLAATSSPSGRDSAAGGFSLLPPETSRQFSATVPPPCFAANTAGRSRSEQSDRPTPASCVLPRLPAWVPRFLSSPRSLAEQDLPRPSPLWPCDPRPSAEIRHSRGLSVFPSVAGFDSRMRRYPPSDPESRWPCQSSPN